MGKGEALVRLPWERAKEEKDRDALETRLVEQRLQRVLDDLRRVIDESEQKIREDVRRGRI